MKKKQVPLTWDELGEIYSKETRQRYRLHSMHTVWDWAAKRKDLFYVGKDKCIYLKQG